MTEQKIEKITPLQNSEEHQKIISDLETEIKTKQAKEATDFKTEYIKLQEKKRGLTWDEAQGWVSMN